MHRPVLRPTRPLDQAQLLAHPLSLLSRLALVGEVCGDVQVDRARINVVAEVPEQPHDVIPVELLAAAAVPRPELRAQQLRNVQKAEVA